MQFSPPEQFVCTQLFQRLQEMFACLHEGASSPEMKQVSFVQPVHMVKGSACGGTRVAWAWSGTQTRMSCHLHETDIKVIKVDKHYTRQMCII